MAKVLLVEDDNNLREIYEARLAAEGYEISSAQDGEEALVVAKQTKPDLVVSDVMMPKISGFEMLDILRNTPGLEHVKVIMLTALGQSEDRDRADSLGADKYLVKSQVTLEDIVKTAHELLGEDTPAPAAAPAAVTPQPEAVAPVPAAPAEPAATEAATAAAAPEPVIPIEAAPTADILGQVAESLDATPAVEPVAAPTTPGIPTAEASAVPEEPVAAPTLDSSIEGTTAQEQAVVAEQISNFEQAPAPIEEPTAAPTVESEPAVVPDAQTVAADDQIMANAIDELTDSVADVTEQPSVTTTEAAATPQPEVVQPEAPVAPEPTDPETAKEEADKTNISISGKKVIQPLDSEPKPDINELLAREEAASGNVATGNAVIAGADETDDTPTEVDINETPAIVHQPGQSFTPQPTSAEEPAPTTDTDDQPSGAPAPAPSEKKDDDFDPNSVAL